MDFTFRRFAIASACAIAATSASAQQANPTTRGAAPHFQLAAGARGEPGIVEFQVTGMSPFSPSCGDRDGTVYIGAEVEPYIAINPLNPNHLVGGWQQDRYSNGGARGQVAGASFDGGATWTRSALPVSACTGGAYERATDPWVSFGPDGTAHQITLAFGGEEETPESESAVIASRSTDGGITWSPPVTIARNTGIFFNDKESITADPLDARFVYAVWDRLLGGSASATVFARSTDGGITWEPARQVYQPPSGSTIGNIVRVLPDGTLVNAFMEIRSSGTSINVIRSTDRGASWSAPILVSNAPARGAEDPQTGTPIRDGAIVPGFAVGPGGTLHIVWQDLRFSQQWDAIAYSRSSDGGLTWSGPVRVNTDTSVTAFTPQVHVRADGTVGVTYYDLRSNTPDLATLLADFWLARSTDGVNWSETRVSSAFDLAKAPFAQGYFLGDYTGLVSAGSTFIALYGKTTGDLENRTDMYLARIGAAASAKSLEATYTASPLPEWELAPELREAAIAHAHRALAQRHLKVQR